MTYYKACIDCNKGVSKKLWQNLRDLVPKENKTLPSNLKVGNKIVTDPTEISECFNTFFHIDSRQIFARNENNPNFTKLQVFIASKTQPHDTFSIPRLSVDEVKKSLLSGKPPESPLSICLDPILTLTIFSQFLFLCCKQNSRMTHP